MVVKIGDLELDTTNISQADIEKLKKMLPEIQKTKDLSELDIILEAIHYIRALESRLRQK